MAPQEKEDSPNENADFVAENHWQLRECHIYKEEYSDCTSMKGRFHQYFIHGKSIDCNQWKHDFDNCVKFSEEKNFKAAVELISSEEKRRKERLRAHYENDVWTKRPAPPPEWNKPLPEKMQKEYENSYLDHKSKELTGAVPAKPGGDRTLCVIM